MQGVGLIRCGKGGDPFSVVRMPESAGWITAGMSSCRCPEHLSALSPEHPGSLLLRAREDYPRTGGPAVLSPQCMLKYMCKTC